jgi:competence protein ComEC
MNHIQRKLQLIDWELSKGRSLLQSTAGTCPLLFAAAGLIFGIFLGDFRHIDSFIFFLVMAAGTVFAVMFFILQKNSHSPLIFAYIVLAGFVGLGGIRINSFYQAKTNDIRHLVGTERKLATIRGIIQNRPRTYRNKGWEFAKFSYKDPSSSFYLKLKQVQTSSGFSKTTGTVRVQVSEPVIDLQAGDSIEAYCWLSRFEESKNPGQFNIAQYLARKGIYIAASINSREAVSVLGKNAGLFTTIKNKFQEKVTQALLSDTSIEESNKALLEALLLGYRGDIDSQTYQAFQETGLLHFISLSGMHLGILVGFIWWLCKIAGFLKRARAFICIIALCAFLLIVPPRAPTLRAAIICLVFCLSFFFQRRINHLNTLSLAAIILLLIRPTQLFEAGWQLSFASVLGILIFTDRIHFFIYEKVTGRAWKKKGKKTNLLFRIVSRPAPYILSLFCVGLAAWLGGAGILLYHFYTINPLTSLWTVVTFPLVALTLTLGYLKIVLSFIAPSLSFVLGIVVNGISAGLIWTVKFIAGLNISQVLIGHVSVSIIIFYYCLLIFVVFVQIRRPLIKQAIFICCCLVMFLLLGALKWQRTYRKDLLVNVLHVGHGQAVLAQLPGGANVLFDAGSLHHKDIGQRIVVPFLNYHGIRKIDSIIISHNDVDHINGIPEIASICMVRKIYASELFFQDADEWGASRFLKSSLARKGLDIDKLSGNLPINSGAKIHFLWPNRKESETEDLSENDKSLVCLIEFAKREILLCSDIEEKAQREILRLYPNLKCDAMLVPHHGSVTTLEQDFIRQVDAKFHICSCDSKQIERQQAKTENSASPWLYTARDGAITITVGADLDMTVSPFKAEKQIKR